MIIQATRYGKVNISKLPDGYMPINWIRSTGTQYIDTGYIPNNNTKIDIVCEADDGRSLSNDVGACIYGSAQQYNSRAFECYSAQGNWEFNYGTQYEVAVAPIYGGRKTRIIQDKNNITIESAGKTFTHSFNTASFTTPYTLCLFATNRSSKIGGREGICTCLIYENNTLVREMYACLRVSDFEPGMYDVVNDVFYANSGSGVFEIPAFLESYTKLEYIQAQGAQWINTGLFSGENAVKFEFGWKEPTLEAGKSLFGSTNSEGGTAKWSGVVYHPAAGSLYVAIGATDGVCRRSDLVANTLYDGVLEADNGALAITANGVKVTGSYQGSIANYTPIYIFADNISGTASEICANTQMCYWRMTENGETVANLVPARHKTLGIVGLLDESRRRFYPNSGSGAFIAGPEIGDFKPTNEKAKWSYSGDFTDSRVDGIGDVTLNTSGTLTVLSGKATVQVYILGGGGGAQIVISFHDSTGMWGAVASGGGGGNQTVEVELVPGTYEIVIGTGGVAAQQWNSSTTDGGNTTAFGYTSNGGGRAYQSNNGGSIAAGTGGSPNGGNGSVLEKQYVDSLNLAGGSPNGGAIVNGVAKNGVNGFVRITFS